MGTTHRHPRVAEARRRAMGSDAHLVVVTHSDGRDGRDLLAAGWGRIDQLEARWSRFRADSEVSALNRHAGLRVRVSHDTVALVQHAVAAWELTAGRFDPTVGAALVGHGYDRDFDELLARGVDAVGSGAATTPWAAPGPAGIEVDAWSDEVRLPAGVTFDPGGIGKGLAADLVATALVETGAAGALVNLGGDLRAIGTPPTATGWTISVADPLRPHQELARIALPQGATATTSRLRRVWSTPHGEAHHLIDPATGWPADTDVVAVTAIADQAWRAEALTKLLFLAGPAELARHHDIHAVLVTADGSRYATRGVAGALR
jgi:thiamine biosynthesis lipoprotein